MLLSGRGLDLKGHGLIRADKAHRMNAALASEGRFRAFDRDFFPFFILATIAYAEALSICPPGFLALKRNA
jgi:hypothetical protein